MPVERSAGIIFFRNTPEGRKYLLIRSSYHGKDGKINHWDFPKGLLQEKEAGIDAARREALEEAGIKNYRLLPEFKSTVRYFIRRERDKKATIKFVALFLAQAMEDEVTLSWEHDSFEWLSYTKALARVSLKEMKNALGEAERYLNK